MDHYLLLGVRHDASKDEIRRSYLSLVKKLHPDTRATKGRPDPEADALFRRVTEAYSVLSSASDRRAYDANINRASYQTRSGRASHWQYPVNNGASTSSTRAQQPRDYSFDREDSFDADDEAEMRRRSPRGRKWVEAWLSFVVHYALSRGVCSGYEGTWGEAESAAGTSSARQARGPNHKPPVDTEAWRAATYGVYGSFEVRQFRQCNKASPYYLMCSNGRPVSGIV
jgi:hypothetical protein